LWKKKRRKKYDHNFKVIFGIIREPIPYRPNHGGGVGFERERK